MPRLFSYCIPVDDGAAPNPFWGVCTLAICKPVIRRTAKVGDWIVATGAKNVNGRNLSGKVIYTMQVTEVMTMAEYDTWSQNHRPEKLPDLENTDITRRVGDSIYDFSFGHPKQRRGVHNSGNTKTDLGGERVLLSRNFYYFGDQPISLPSGLLQEIIHQTQGHKVNANEGKLEPFLQWLNDQKLEKNCLVGIPDRLHQVSERLNQSAKIRVECAASDECASIC